MNKALLLRVDGLPPNSFRRQEYGPASIQRRYGQQVNEPQVRRQRSEEVDETAKSCPGCFAEYLGDADGAVTSGAIFPAIMPMMPWIQRTLTSRVSLILGTNLL